MSRLTQTAVRDNRGATIFAYPVKDPERFGVIEFDGSGRPTKIVEKPKNPRSHFAVTGLYVYDNDVVEIASALVPSARGELEITDLNMRISEGGRLDVKQHGSRHGVARHRDARGAAAKASQFVQTIEHRQGLKIACPEEVAWRLRWIDDAALTCIADEIGRSSYAEYLIELLRDAKFDGTDDGRGTGSAFWDAMISSR